MADMSMRERKKEATKSNILNAAIELIMNRGFNETTMQAIAQRADIALRTLYNYFSSKEAIVANYLRSVVEDEVERSWHNLLRYETTAERLRFVCRKTAEWSMANPVLTEIYASDPRNYFYAPTKDVPRSGIDELVARVLEMGREIGDVTLDVPVEVMVRQFMGFLYLNILTWLGHPEVNLLTMFEEGLKIYDRGIRPVGVRPDNFSGGILQ